MGGLFFIIRVGFLVVGGRFGLVKVGGWLVLVGCAVVFSHFSKLLSCCWILGTILVVAICNLGFLGNNLGAVIVSNWCRSFCTTLSWVGLVWRGGGSKSFFI